MFIGLIILGTCFLGLFLVFAFVDLESLSRKRKLRIAKKRANELHNATGQRYYVVPFGKEGNVIVVNNEYVDIYNKINRKKVPFKKINTYELEKMAYYATSAKRSF